MRKHVRVRYPTSDISHHDTQIKDLAERAGGRFTIQHRYDGVVVGLQAENQFRFKMSLPKAYKANLC